MSNCVCTAEERKVNGYILQGLKSVCNKCQLTITAETHAADVSEAAIKSDFKFSEINKKVPSTPMEKRISGIEDIVRRMWIWISFQAIFIGIWFGNAFAETKVSTDYWGDTSVSQEFNFGMFLMGVLIGFGSFAPLVFVVQALKEVVLNIVKGPLDKRELN